MEASRDGMVSPEEIFRYIGSGKIHPSHQLARHRGVVYCKRCFHWAVNVPRKLRGVCKQLSAGGAEFKRRMVDPKSEGPAHNYAWPEGFLLSDFLISRLFSFQAPTGPLAMVEFLKQDHELQAVGVEGVKVDSPDDEESLSD